MRNVFIYSSRPSNGARELANALNVRRIRNQGSHYSPRPQHTIINWGSTATPFDTQGVRVLNRPGLVARTSNKLSFFQAVTASAIPARIPNFTSDEDEAFQWVDEGFVVVARTILSGHSGNGIVIISSGVDFVSAPLYTKYVKKEAEYRVHCIRGPQGPNSFDVQRKIKDPAFEGDPNWRVRNHQNGFIYVRDNIQIPEDVTRQALQAFATSGLDFGAVDVIWNQHQGLAYVLEINTAPGLIGRSVQSYKEAFTRALTGS